jgi:hypothetical protein
MTRQELAKLTPGDRVRLTDDAIEQGLKGRATSREGTVVRVFGKRAGLLEVRRDGIKTPSCYGCGHWDIAS